jgi:dTDP-4-dehydrorhamnose reductase
MLDNSRILITGADGLLGQRFTPLCKRHCQQRHPKTRIFTTYHHPPTDVALLDEHSSVGELTDDRFILELIEKSQPDVIVNLAALTVVEQCETDATLAQRVNVGVVNKLLSLAPSARFVQLSTDYVFDGAKGLYQPGDTPAPISLYGQTKRDAEIAALRSANNLIVRTSGTYDWLEKNNLFTFFYNRLIADKETLALAGCYYSPIWAADLAAGLLGLLESNTTGIIHYAGPERQTRHDFALTIAKALNLDESLLRPTMQEKFNWKAKRPVDSSLDSEGGYGLAGNIPGNITEVCDLF